MHHKKTYKDNLRDIVNAYIDQGNEWPTDLKTVSVWAISKDLWERQPTSAIKELASHLQEAMREEYYTDPQGRRVRTKHSFRKKIELPDGTKKQSYLWVDIDTATPEEMQTCLQQRRRQIVGDCAQYKTDGDSYNDNNPYGVQLVINLDFTEDVAELEQNTEYGQFSDDDDE